MIGVILWRSRDNGNAVIWCEDQGDLAFIDHQNKQLDGPQAYDVGDVVGFDLAEAENLRSAENIHRLQDEGAPHLVKSLQSTVAARQAANEDNVITFPRERLVAT